MDFYEKFLYLDLWTKVYDIAHQSLNQYAVYLSKIIFKSINTRRYMTFYKLLLWSICVALTLKLHAWSSRLTQRLNMTHIYAISFQNPSINEIVMNWRQPSIHFNVKWALKVFWPWPWSSVWNIVSVRYIWMSSLSHMHIYVHN